jgi:hypothetical protein
MLPSASVMLLALALETKELRFREIPYGLTLKPSFVKIDHLV